MVGILPVWRVAASQLGRCHGGETHRRSFIDKWLRPLAIPAQTTVAKAVEEYQTMIARILLRTTARFRRPNDRLNGLRFAIALVMATFPGIVQAQTPTWPDSLPSKPRAPGQGPIPSPGQVAPGSKTGEQLVQVGMAADVGSLTAGQTFNLAFVFTIEPGWHIYWKNSGASGAPTSVKISAPPGFVVGDLRFPRPIVIEGEEGTTYGYETKTVLYVPVTAPIEHMPTTAIFSARIDWLVCKDICLMGKASPQLSVPTRQGSGTAPAPVDPMVEEYKRFLPQPLASHAKAQISHDGGNLTIRLPAQGFQTGQFFPLANPGIEFGPAAVTVDDKDLVFTVPVEIKPGNAMGKPLVLAGAVGLGDTPNSTHWEFESPADPAGAVD